MIQRFLAIKRILNWKKVKGDITYRLNYDLTPKSVVLDLGGYEGQWASDIFAKYTPTVHVIEPIPKFAKFIQNRFAKNSKIKVHQLALGATDQPLTLFVHANQTSAFEKCGVPHKIKQQRFDKFYRLQKLAQIDLAKLNIEGGEYDLLDHLIETGLIKNIKNLQIQFHPYGENYQQRYQQIVKALAKTHHRTWYFPQLWENWQLKTHSK